MPADPNAPVPTDAPIYASPPDLRVSTADGFTHSPKHPNEKIWLSESMQADEAGNEVFRWAYFNRFDVEALEVEHTEWRTTATTKPEFRVVPVGGGVCQQEQAVVEEEYRYKFALLKQYYEQWVTDTLLKDYYDTLLSPAAGAAGCIGDNFVAANDDGDLYLVDRRSDLACHLADDIRVDPQLPSPERFPRKLEQDASAPRRFIRHVRLLLSPTTYRSTSERARTGWCGPFRHDAYAPTLNRAKSVSVRPASFATWATESLLSRA